MAKVFDIVIDFEKSQGSYIYDKKTQASFLDFYSMYSSLPLGYNHSIFDESFRKKVASIAYLRMANNIFYSDEYEEFIALFSQYVFGENIHFTCTGALAVESSIKAAMHYKKVKEPVVIGVKKSFHGVNSWGFLTDRVGINEKRLEFFPTNNWYHLDLDEIIDLLENGDIANLVAIIIEPIQCTNGDIYLDKTKLQKIRQLCLYRDICFILDEIQTGFGVTGKMWYYEHLELIPDILVFGKKSQVCGICTNDKYSEILKNPYQKLDVTFDGELIDIIRATYILKAYSQLNIMETVSINSKQIQDAISKHTMNYRSIGHLMAFDFETTELRNEFVKLCYENNLLINKAGQKAVRLRPNLALTNDELNRFISIVNTACEKGN
jgi:L-lysine 6-transaminase